MEINSTDLENALKVVRATVGSSNDISSHYVFRSLEGSTSLEVLSNDGRTFSQCVIANTVVESGDIVAFTVEARRIHVLLDSVGANQPLTLTYADSVVTVKGSRGKVIFSSLDPTLFPYWDEVFAGAKSTAKMAADRLHAAFSHAKQFTFTDESKAPNMCVAEFRGGVLYSTDQMSVSVVKVPGMEESNLRVFVKDLPNVLSFLSGAKNGEVEIRESDRASFIIRADGAVFGETVYTHKFPPFTVDWKDMSDDESWEVIQADLLDGVKFLQSGSRLDEPRVKFERKDSNLTLSMTAVSGTPLSLTIPISDSDSKNSETSLPVFSITDVYLAKMLSGYTGPKVRMGVSKKKKDGGWVRVREERGLDTYLTTIVWLKNV